MKEKETEFTIKIKTYSKSTIEKITNLMTSKERFYIICDIVISSKTEQEVVEKLDIISQVNEKEFTQKLMTFSKSTMQKITNIANSEKVLPKIYQIVMEAKAEQEVLEKLDKISQVNEKEYRQKIATFSKSTMQKIMSTMTSNDKVMPIYRIVMGAKTEQQVIKELENLQNKNSNLL